LNILFAVNSAFSSKTVNAQLAVWTLSLTHISNLLSVDLLPDSAVYYSRQFNDPPVLTTALASWKVSQQSEVRQNAGSTRFLVEHECEGKAKLVAAGPTLEGGGV
jgi:hypothetical protein